jgi:hypothetical protein
MTEKKDVNYSRYNEGNEKKNWRKKKIDKKLGKKINNKTS